MKELELLHRVNKVDAPPYLVTRVLAQHRSTQKELRLAWALVSICIVLAVLGAILPSGPLLDTSPNDLAAFSKELRSSATNQLYR